MFYLYALVSHLIYTVNTVSKTLVKLGMMKLHGFVLIGFAQYFHELNASSNIYGALVKQSANTNATATTICIDQV